MDTNPNLYAPLRTPGEVHRWPHEDIGRASRRTGLDYQGRWPEFADTMPTQPARLDGAHCCSGITSASDDDGPGQGSGVLLVPVCMALSLVSAWALYAWLSAPL